MSIEILAAKAKQASIRLGALAGEQKNLALSQIAANLRKNAGKIAATNKIDIGNAEKANLAASLLKRLKFDEKKIEDVCSGIESTITLEDPVGKTLAATELDAGLELYKVSCPIGVIGIIFESRPDALVQISTLCLKSSNACLLKGGSEAEHTNKVLAELITEATDKAGVPSGWLQLLQSREDVRAMLSLDDYIDLIIPRGSNEFVRYIMDNTNIAVLGHADGICHVYVDGLADIKKAVDIAIDSKCQYVAVCNAAETLLVDGKIASEFLPEFKKAAEQKELELRGCEKTAKIISCLPATEQDWKTEYLDNILSVKIVDGLDAAIEHINRYGSGHTDCIVTEDRDKAKKFMELVDSADVFWNASTRFSDGFRYGLGAEVGISTNKIHARGPVGLEGLVIYKWKLIGTGQTVADYSSGGKKFGHKKLNRNFEL
ncbi:MAG: glutamate-5-semialdehyde dehydrogenase [Phycisphaerae bacterium]|nr:glutamate-5-semialdehyde dehydrogenase [Phycisphaerae bacterium]